MGEWVAEEEREKEMSKQEEKYAMVASGAVIGLLKLRGWSRGVLIVVVRTVGRVKEEGGLVTGGLAGSARG